MAGRTTAGDTRTDRELLRAAAGGDRRAFAAFTERYRTDVNRMLRRSRVRLGQRSAVAAVVFHVAVAQHERLGDNTRTWLARLAASIAAEELFGVRGTAHEMDGVVSDLRWTEPPDDVDPRLDTRLEDEVRLDRAVRRAIEGTDADPLVRARRARERLAAIDV